MSGNCIRAVATINYNKPLTTMYSSYYVKDLLKWDESLSNPLNIFYNTLNREFSQRDAIKGKNCYIISHDLRVTGYNTRKIG